MAMAFALGLGLGCGLAYLREMLDPAFYNPEDVAAFLELPIMVSIPMADMEKEV
jgi:capsular polysaccharide biosynthesis protein